MSAPSELTLDQLRVFQKVADCGSFSAAARELKRTQSVVSYTVARLETQLGLTLFDRGGRRPKLTEAGEAVLSDSRRVGLAIHDLRARAHGLVRGLETEISLAVDAMIPDDVIVGVSRDFAAAFPTVALELRVEPLEATVRMVMDGDCTMGITGPIFELPDGMNRRHCGVVRMVTVVAAGHPLASPGERLSTSALREHTELLLISRELRPGFEHAVRAWQVSSLALLKALLCAGLGWAIMPEAMVRAEVASGALTRLELTGSAEWPYPLDLVRRVDTPLTPATRWLADHLSAAIGGLV